MADTRYNSSNNTSPAVNQMKSERPRVKSSSFDLSRMRHLNGVIGAIMPIDWLPVFPGDAFNLDYFVNIKLRNPLAKDAMTGFKCYVHAFYSRMSDLWEGAEVFLTSGDTGNVSFGKPWMNMLFPSPFDDCSFDHPMTLFDFMGVQVGARETQGEVSRMDYLAGFSPARSLSREVGKVHATSKLDALPFVMYQKIYISKYMNYNLVQENRNFVPLNQKHLILPYEANGQVNCLHYTNYFLTENNNYDPTDINGLLYVPSSADPNTPVYLGAIRFRQFESDYFTTSSPFEDLVRGELPFFDIPVVGENQFLNLKLYDDPDSTVAYRATSSTTASARSQAFIVRPGSAGSYVNSLGSDGDSFSSVVGTSVSSTNLGIDISSYSAQGLLTMDDLYSIEALTLFRRRNAMSNGRYNSIIEAQYGRNPKANHHEPIYIGGSTFDLLTQVVMQTSQTTNDSQLGEKAGQMQGSNVCSCGYFNVPDFGYIMVVMSIVPDTYYSQGLDREFTLLSQEDVYYPIFNQLPPDTIRRSEVFYSGTPTVDEDLFAWKERYSEYKSRRNKVNGFMALSDFEDSSYVAQRRFSDSPTLTNGFVTLSPGNVDMSIFSVIDEPPFIMSIGCSVRGRRPLPFATVPGGSLNPNLG